MWSLTRIPAHVLVPALSHLIIVIIIFGITIVIITITIIAVTITTVGFQPQAQC